MKGISRVAIVGVVVTAACMRAGMEIRTMAEPNAQFSTLHTFRMLPAPPRRDGLPASGDDDPMINNSIANRAIQDRIVKAFADRGYVYDQMHGDFAVAFYASSREKLDVTNWDYGYPFDPRVAWYPREQTITQYTEGTMIVDVLKTGPRQLLWRGQGRGELTGDSIADVNRLANAAAAIVSKFPAATKPLVAFQP